MGSNAETATSPGLGAHVLFKRLSMHLLRILSVESKGYETKYR